MNSKELARLIGVSQSTISRALNGSPQISEKRRQEIMELAKKHNFEFNLNARNLRNQTSNLVGILMPGHFSNYIHNDYRSRLFNYLFVELSKHEFSPILLNDTELFNDVSALKRAVNRLQFAGLILWGRTEADDVLSYFKTLRIPVFAMTRCNEKMQFLPSVSINNYRQGYLMGEHFASRGYRRVATVTPSHDQMTYGFRDALENHGIHLGEEDVFREDGNYQATYDLVRNRMNQLRSYEALFFQTDDMALGALNAFKDSGLSIPEDIAVAGNNDMPFSQWCSPKLTTVDPRLQQQAEVTCRRLVSMIKDGVDPVEEKHFVVQPRLIIRESCP